MLERVQDAPAQTLALRASGTVVARDVEAAIGAALSEAATGLVIVIDPDFDGYFAELARGLRQCRAGSQVAGQARGRHRSRTDGRSQPRRLRSVARSCPAVRSRRRERRARMGRGGPAGRVEPPRRAGRFRACCIWVESMALAHPPPIARREAGVLPDALCGGGRGWGVALAREVVEFGRCSLVA